MLETDIMALNSAVPEGNDDAQLAALGHQSELKRNFSSLYATFHLPARADVSRI